MYARLRVKMSRVGRKPIKIPDNVNLEEKNRSLHIKGPKGELTVKIPQGIETKVVDGEIKIAREGDEKRLKAFHGLVRSLIDNSITGVTEGFSKTLEIVGTGYKAELIGKDKLKMSLGYSNPIEFILPEGIAAKIEERGTVLILESIDKQLVGETAARVRKLRLPDAYKGKGVKYKGERLRLKPGKAGAKK